MDNKELKELTQEISIKYFGKEFNNRIVFNSRLRTTGGRFFHNDKHIDVNPKMLTLGSKDLLVGVIKHELCHYFLADLHLRRPHGDKRFRDLLKKVDGPRFVPLLEKQPVRHVRHMKYVYECTECYATFTRKRKVNTDRYSCECGGHLKLIKTVDMDKVNRELDDIFKSMEDAGLL